MKKLSIAKQLKDAKAEVVALVAKIESLQKILENETKMKDYYSKQSSDRHTEIESMHDILDAMPNAPTRKKEGSYTEMPLSIRFAAWLASRN